MADETQILDPVGLDDQVRNSAASFPASPASQPNHVAHRFLGASRIEPRNGLAPCCRSVINGSAPPINATTLHSELFYHRNATVNQNSIALSSDRGSLEIAGVSLLYEGTRVKSYLLGRDLNPMGRGDGQYYPEGMFSAGNTRPVPNDSPVGGRGNSINNETAGWEVEKDPGHVNLAIYSNSIHINYSSGDCNPCKHCYQMIPVGGCWLTILMYGSCGHCGIIISCLCGGLRPEATWIGPKCFGDGEDWIQIPASPMPGGGLGDPGCPGCDMPGMGPWTNMPGPNFPNIPGRGGIPGIPGEGGGLMGRNLYPIWMYGPGVPKDNANPISDDIRVLHCDEACLRDCWKRVYLFRPYTPALQEIFNLPGDLGWGLELAVLAIALYCGPIGEGLDFGILASEIVRSIAWRIKWTNYCYRKCCHYVTTGPPSWKHPRPVD
jgi:hypothetical protein